jgi:hypothetical protein
MMVKNQPAAGGPKVPGGYGSPSPRIAKVNQKPYRAPSSTGKKP